MELDLNAARVAREVEAQIKAALALLPSVAAQKDVLQRVAVDVLAAVEPSGSSTAKPVRVARRRVVVNKKPRGKAKSRSEAAVAANETRHAGGMSLWEAILTYCEQHPAPKATPWYRTPDIAEALMPEKAKTNRNVALSTVYSAVKRRSVGESSEPVFFWLDKGRFRLATPEEHARSKEDAT